MGNVMLLKPFETSVRLSTVYKVKGEVKVIRDGKAEHSKFQTKRVGLATTPFNKKMENSTKSCCDRL